MERCMGLRCAKLSAFFLAVLLVPLSFAAWEPVAFLAISTSVAILAILYAVGTGFGVNELQLMAKEEFFQLIALGVIIVALFAGDNLLNSISAMPEFTNGSATMQDGASSLIDSEIADLGSILSEISDQDKSISVEASRAGSCNIMGMGYTVSGCGGYSMLSTPLSMAGGVTGFAIGELGAIKRLVVLSQTYALGLLLPVGIVLRTLKITRGAGGFLIALGISLHIMLPASIIFNEMLGATFLADEEASADYQPGSSTLSIAGCNPSDATPLIRPDSGTQNERNAIAAYQGMKVDLRRYLYVVLVRATLGPVLALLVLAASVRSLSSVAGAEVDVTPITRFI